MFTFRHAAIQFLLAGMHGGVWSVSEFRSLLPRVRRNFIDVRVSLYSRILTSILQYLPYCICQRESKIWLKTAICDVTKGSDNWVHTKGSIKQPWGPTIGGGGCVNCTLEDRNEPVCNNISEGVCDVTTGSNTEFSNAEVSNFTKEPDVCFSLRDRDSRVVFIPLIIHMRLLRQSPDWDTHTWKKQHTI